MNKVRKRFTKNLICLFTAVVVGFFGSRVALADAVGMVTGSKTGTYIQFGNEIAEQARKLGLEIEVKESTGSLANIERINSKENAAFGIVQSDVMGFLERDTELNQRLAKRLRYIYPFYLEEVHVLARKEIQTLRDLQGKRVSVGVIGSGTWLTANNLFKILDVKPAVQENLETEEGIIKVLTNELDAVFYVAGKPVKAFEPLDKMVKATTDSNAQRAIAGVHFLPITEQEVLVEYEKEQLTPNEYPWLQQDVPTVAVRAVLVGFDWSSRKNRYYRSRCEQLALLGRAISENLDELKRTGHAKWQQVDLDNSVKSWDRDICSHKGIERKSERKPGEDAMRALEKYFRDKPNSAD